MDSVRAFLESAKSAHARAARLSRKIVQLTTQVEHITPSYSGMPSGGSSSPVFISGHTDKKLHLG